MTHYYTEYGGYAAAVNCALTIKGQFFPGRSKDSAHTVVRGSEVYTFWEEDSVLRKNVILAAKQYNYDPEHMTAGRLCRSILRDIVGLHPKGTFYGRTYRKLSNDGFHWHYQHVEPGYHPYLVEFDLRSAYMTSLMAGRTFFYHEVYGWQDDGGALECMREIYPTMPKWLRLTMLGIIASHRTTFYKIEEVGKGQIEMKPTTINKIEWGAAFNAVHGAILRTWRTMEKIHQIGGKHVKRMHTDSFAVSPELDYKAEGEIFELLSSKGFDVSIKASGSALFINLNEGVIGRKLIGSKHELEETMKLRNLKIKREWIDYDEMLRFTARVPGSKLDYVKEKTASEETPDTVEQMSLPLVTSSVNRW